MPAAGVVMIVAVGNPATLGTAMVSRISSWLGFVSTTAGGTAVPVLSYPLALIRWCEPAGPAGW